MKIVWTVQLLILFLLLPACNADQAISSGSPNATGDPTIVSTNPVNADYPVIAENSSGLPFILDVTGNQNGDVAVIWLEAGVTDRISLYNSQRGWYDSYSLGGFISKRPLLLFKAFMSESGNLMFAWVDDNLDLLTVNFDGQTWSQRKVASSIVGFDLAVDRTTSSFYLVYKNGAYTVGSIEKLYWAYYNATQWVSNPVPINPDNLDPSLLLPESPLAAVDASGKLMIIWHSFQGTNFVYDQDNDFQVKGLIDATPYFTPGTDYQFLDYVDSTSKLTYINKSPGPNSNRITYSEFDGGTWNTTSIKEIPYPQEPIAFQEEYLGVQTLTSDHGVHILWDEVVNARHVLNYMFFNSKPVSLPEVSTYIFPERVINIHFSLDAHENPVVAWQSLFTVGIAGVTKSRLIHFNSLSQQWQELQIPDIDNSVYAWQNSNTEHLIVWNDLVANNNGPGYTEVINSQLVKY